MITVFVSYVIFISFKYGIQTSISESYYVLPPREKFLFVLFTWLFAFPAIFLGNSLLMFFAGGGIIFVGAAAAMHKMPIRAIHLTAAIGGIILGCIAIILQYNMWYMVVGSTALIPIAYLFDKKDIMWWTEIIVFTAISITIGLSLFS
jgi:hypothetical protein